MFIIILCEKNLSKTNVHIKHASGNGQITDIMITPLQVIRFKEQCNLLGLFSFKNLNVN